MSRLLRNNDAETSSPGRSLKLDDWLIDGQSIADTGHHLCHFGVTFSNQYVLHLHRLNHGQILTRSNIVAYIRSEWGG